MSTQFKSNYTLLMCFFFFFINECFSASTPRKKNRYNQKSVKTSKKITKKSNHFYLMHLANVWVCVCVKIERYINLFKMPTDTYVFDVFERADTTKYIYTLRETVWEIRREKVKAIVLHVNDSLLSLFIRTHTL